MLDGRRIVLRFNSVNQDTAESAIVDLIYYGHLVTIVTSKIRREQEAFLVNGYATKQLPGLPKAWWFADVRRPPSKIDFCNHLSQLEVNNIWRNLLDSRSECVHGQYRDWPIGRLSDGRCCISADGFSFKQDQERPGEVLQVVIRDNKKKKVEDWTYGQRPIGSVCKFLQVHESVESSVNEDEPEPEQDSEWICCHNTDDVEGGNLVCSKHGGQWLDGFITFKSANYVSIYWNDLRVEKDEIPITDEKKSVSGGKSILQRFDCMESRRVLLLSRMFLAPPCFHGSLASYNSVRIMAGLEPLVFEITKITKITNQRL